MNLVVLLAGIVGGFSGLFAVPTLFFLARNAKHESEALRDKPLRDALQAMTDDRDYWRDKCDNLESRMQGRDSR